MPDLASSIDDVADFFLFGLKETDVRLVFPLGASDVRLVFPDDRLFLLLVSSVPNVPKNVDPVSVSL